MEPASIAAQLRELAMYYELDGDRHRAFAYDKAAKSIDATQGLQRLIDEGRLEELPNIGPSTARVIAELSRTGRVAVLDRMRTQWPSVVIELATLPKVGVQKARKIFKSLTPPDLDAVAAMCRSGVISELPGFGKVSEQKILQSIEERKLNGTRVILVEAEDHAASLAHHLRSDPAISRVEICGPVRRWCEVVDVLAYAVMSKDRDRERATNDVANRLAEFGLVTSVDRSSDPLVGFVAGGLKCEIHVAAPGRFGWTMIEATGSRAHVSQLRERAVERGIDLTKLDADDEALVYRALGLPWLPPEVRDGTDEIAAAVAGDDFSDLITLDDITVASHCHTTESDGKNSLVDMVRGAAERGFDAITITDHSANASYANGLDLDRLRAQAADIAALDTPDALVMHGTEADILEDGTIDVPPEMIGKLGVIIASVHQRYKLDEDGMTRRVIAAMKQPYFKIWGHPLGRLVLRRDPIAVRIDEVLDALAESRGAIEINGDPYRLDLDPENVRRAARRGIQFVLASDAHSVRAIAAVRYAVGLARRARLRKKDVINARPAGEVIDLIRPNPS
ncbi:MAG: DNA polymerase/3'-5' exonuclease PolX [Deltaproteobacteria bacterium]|nr:DNA polymerase/3'-5' exonuclease PolX [Deltaproteobacteria bacterium]